MTIQIYDGSAWKNVDTVQIYDGSAWKNVDQMYIYDGSAWKTFLFLDEQVVTVGVYDVPGGGFPPVPSFTIYGYYFSIGSISDGTFDVKSGAAITQINYKTLGSVVFEISGTYTNTGWTNMNIAGTDFARTSATFSTSGGTTVWSWTTATNPFGTTVGATKQVSFS